MSYTFTDKDKQNIISKTSQDNAKKYINFRNGQLTQYVIEYINQLKEQTTATASPINKNVFQVQNWHGSNFKKRQGQYPDNIGDYFNVLQDSWQNNPLTDNEKQNIQKQNIYLAGYHWTHKYVPVLDFLTENNVPEIFTSCRYNTKMNEDTKYSNPNHRLNPLNGDTIEAIILYAVTEIKEIVEKYPVTKIMIDSEFRTGVGSLGISFDTNELPSSSGITDTALQGSFNLTYNGQKSLDFEVPSYDLGAHGFYNKVKNIDGLLVSGDKYYNGLYWSGRGYMNLMSTDSLDFDIEFDETNLQNGKIHKTYPTVTKEVARLDGLSALIPQYPQGTQYYKPHHKILDIDDKLNQGLQWSLKHGHYGVTIRALRKAIQMLYPQIQIYTDPVFLDNFNLEFFKDMDCLQSWTQATPTIRQTYDIAQEVCLFHVHKRYNKNNPPILVGPQLAYHEDFGYNEHRGIPQDIFTTACWMSFGFGGMISHWGHSWTIDENGNYYPNGQKIWESLKRLKQQVYNPCERLLSNWEQKKNKRVALWFSALDHISMAGGRDKHGHIKNNVFRALLMTGEPFDIIYDEEITDKNILDNYEVLIIPSAYITNTQLVDKIKNFADNNKTVITHVDCTLNSIIGNVKILDGPYHENGSYPLLPNYSYDGIKKGTGLKPHAYVNFLTNLAEHIQMQFPFDSYVCKNNSDVISNIMEYDGNEYLVLINNNRKYGQEVDYWNSKATNGQQLQYDLDEGIDTEVSVSLPYKYIGTDILTNEQFSEQTIIPVEKGWGRILKLQKQGTNSMMIFDVTMPLLTKPHDVVNRKLTMTIDDKEPIIIDVDPNAISVDGLKAPIGSQVKLTLIDCDASGNCSEEASILEQTIEDTIKPATPGPMLINITGQDYGSTN